ncbi:MAG TPA: 30S ribosomal protein S6 [Dehalococcoidia bacterium]|nr:30S ribosomal protein S6 [Dehalococcoidia bacterium]
MNEYELLYIVHPRRTAEETTAVIEWVAGLVTSSGGEILSEDNWGRRKLAYPINHETEGTYVLLNLNMPPEGANALEPPLVISEDIIRHIVIKGIIPFEGVIEPQVREQTPEPAPDTPEPTSDAPAEASTDAPAADAPAADATPAADETTDETATETAEPVESAEPASEETAEEPSPATAAAE